MLKYDDLLENFTGVVEIENGVIKAEDELNSKTVYYYFKLASEMTNGYDCVVISENNPDDKFASLVLANVGEIKESARLSLRTLPENKYGFPQIILAPKEFHKYLMGRLDDERDRLVLCLPVHKGEFSGTEAIDDFFLLRREIIDTLNWKREISSQVQIRFDNPKTGVGTTGAYVLVKYKYLLREIDKLDGIEEGFIEILNYLDGVAEILSQGMGQFIYIFDRDDSARELLSKDQLIERVKFFLTS